MSFPTEFIQDPEILAAYSEDGGGSPMTAKYLARPGTEEELVELVKYCSSENLSITPTGARTCDTASGLADRGVLVSFEKMKSVLEINKEELYCDVQPGVFLFDLKKTLESKGLFYPPDPSSEKIATLGGTVATNAAGARSFKYGQTVRHIEGLTVVGASGEKLEVSRTSTKKNATGPASLSNLCSLFVGSEGILGPFSKIRLKLIEGVPQAFAVMAFLKSEKELFEINLKLNSKGNTVVSPRSLEFLDNSCLGLIRDSGEYKNVPKEAQFAIISEQEFIDGEKDSLVEAWLAFLDKEGALIEDTIFADSQAKIQALRDMRHIVPSGVWEMGKSFQAKGGKKVSTDWAVPIERMAEMFARAEKLCIEFGFPPERTFRYAHLGDGHPHFNFIPENTEETERCLKLREALSDLALSIGGTVAGEHGVGKLRKSLYQREVGPDSVRAKLLRSIKVELDPNGIMAPGNIV